MTNARRSVTCLLSFPVMKQHSSLRNTEQAFSSPSDRLGVSVSVSGKCFDFTGQTHRDLKIGTLPNCPIYLEMHIRKPCRALRCARCKLYHLHIATLSLRLITKASA